MIHLRETKRRIERVGGRDINDIPPLITLADMDSVRTDLKVFGVQLIARSFTRSSKYSSTSSLLN